MAMISTIPKRRAVVTITIVSIFALLLNPPTSFALATPSIASRAKTTSTPRRKSWIPSPLFMSSADAASSSSSEISSMNGPDATISTPAPAKEDDGKTKLIDKIRKLSNFASFLCVLDCTLLPIITVALPLLGVLNLGPSQMEYLHHLGHQLALYFVLPVGGTTGIINYLSHKKAWIGSMTLVGLTLVGFANSHIHHLPLVGHVELLHMIQHGPLHRVTNVLGCAFLLGSNYLSQQQGCAFHDHGDGECSESSHDHSHSHDHGQCSSSHDHSHSHSHDHSD